MNSNNLQEETREFQAEVKQMLDIVINSLYTNREIFLRELISNASDALEKLRYLKITNKEILDRDLPLEISINTDDIAHTLTIQDTGIGMTREELVENLGTIAHSGSKAFIKQLTENDRKDVELIGQFGVGFYSAFMVADKVTVYTRSCLPEAQGYIWSSEGTGSYTIKEALDLKRGTKIVLHLKNDAQEFAKPETIKRIIKQYSGFVQFPILVNGEKANTVQPLWTKNKNEVSDEEYNEFYKYIANVYDEPLFRLHFSADAPLSINALLFVPKENLERFGFGQLDPGVNLYCRKVLIQQQAEGILPKWLRFVKGVVDSEELPLNISRETMQDNMLVSKLRRVLTSRFLKFLNEQSRTETEKYNDFWKKFGIFIKEGLATDFEHKEELLKLLRFESSKTEPGKLISLKEYLDRKTTGQKAIYFLNGPNREVIEASPYLEIFRKKDLEVLYTFDAVDDYVLNQLGEYEGNKFVSADQENLELPDDGGHTPAADGLAEADVNALADWLKQQLGEKVTDVKASKRLTDSPAIVLNPGYMTNSMQRMMQLINKELDYPVPKVLEINTTHPIIKRLDILRKNNDPFAKVAAEQIYDNALIAAGLNFDPKGMVNRLNQILERALQ
ncbi:molecular chaperone HtpG [Zhaonella formicivorans]|uniref:molecular chaperone HtpG n=1 Tax=Zhaonella formicivorans TaxID=2528593 RepID=UPI0010D78BEA|nr:molecular chaperone HtpG [Zhaonella formicivorans]